MLVVGNAKQSFNPSLVFSNYLSLTLKVIAGDGAVHAGRDLHPARAVAEAGLPRRAADVHHDPAQLPRHVPGER